MAVRRGIQHRRLNSTIEMYERELRGLRERPVTASGSAAAAEERASRWWRGPADELLELAREFAKKRDLNSAWDALHSSQRLTFYELSDEELAARASALREEVESKLVGWRRDAALAALDGDHGWPPVALADAQELLDQHYTNVYIKLEMSSERIVIAALLLTATTGMVWVGAAVGFFRALKSSEPFILTDGLLFGGVVLLGMLGSMLSLALDSKAAAAGVATGRIYEFTSTRVAVPLARLAIGAAAAVVVVAVAQAATAIDPLWAVLAAIPAGFSERVVRRAVAELESQARR